ncbi:MAG: 50S ribosomal protein L16 [Candidatus ainarchaeum sp.]|nr:50S ribosomal protein L16 [Candidatus ainarchaeum sp.]
MGIRPARSIRDADKPPWTRYSKTKPRRSYIKSMPHKDLNQYRMGVEKPDYDLAVHMVSQQDILLRDNALESSRQSANKQLELKVAGNYFFLIRPYPHHVIRENKMIAGAGADRLQKGMRKAFGRPVDRAARISNGQKVFSIYTYKSNLPSVRIALDRAMKKLSGNYRVEINESAPKI